MAGAKKRAKKPVGRDRVLFNILSYAVLTALSAACLLPFLLVLSGSVSEQYSIQLHGYRLFPETISLDAYKMLFRIPQELLRAYGVTIFVTAVGTVLGLWLTSMAAYVLSSRDFRYRYQVSFFFYFTSIFGGGLVPWYIFNTKYLHFHNSVIALNYWNDWYNAMLFLDEGSRNLYPLQYFLNNILTKAQAMNAAAARSGIPASDVPSEPMKLAMTVVATGPIILLYPFLQKYCVKGVTIGAVKG